MNDQQETNILLRLVIVNMYIALSFIANYPANMALIVSGILFLAISFKRYKEVKK